jgi:D-ribose pyranase
MKRSGILNAQLSRALAELGHGHLVVVGDAGLPRPAGVECVDLALELGVPTFAQVLTALASELVVEQATLATEALDANPGVVELVTDLAGTPGFVSHEELKRLSGTARVYVRTGEATPYANVVLRCGVPF